MVRKLSALLIFVASLSTGIKAPNLSVARLPVSSGEAFILPGDPDDPTQTPVGQPTSTPIDTPLATPTPVLTDTSFTGPALTPTSTPSPTVTFTPTSTPMPSDIATQTAVPLATRTPDVLTQACVEANRLLIWTLSRLFLLDRSQVIKWFCESYRFREIQSYNPPGAYAQALPDVRLIEDREFRLISLMPIIIPFK